MIPADAYTVLIADDEPDVHAITHLALRALQFKKRPVVLRTTSSGKETVQALRSDPMIAVVLLDVVMESNSAGLDACKAIRGELGNRFVRILLRTGQPGVAPERKTIDEYDIDGYLPKPEMTSMRLYSVVRTALKAWAELVELDRYRRHLAAVHECLAGIHSFDPLEQTLERILETAVAVCPTSLAVLSLSTFEKSGSPRRFFMHISTEPDRLKAQTQAEEVRARVSRDPAAQAARTPTALDGGVLVPFALHRQLGSGWLFLEGGRTDELVTRALSLLAGHAGNALYSAVAQELLEARDAASPDVLAI